MTVRLVVSEIFKDDNQGLDSSEPFLFVLPAAGRRALLSLSELLTWEATWIEVDPASGRQIRTPLTDRQQAIIDATRDGLMEFEQVNLIVAKLEEIRQEIELLRSASTNDDTTLELIATGVGALDPRLALLLEGVDAIENLMGGSWTPGP